MSSQHSESKFEPVGLDKSGPVGVPHRKSTRTDTASAMGFRATGPAFKALIGVLIVIGLVARIAPFFDVDNRLLEQFVTEDGYFMLAIARNLAIGNGFSIADGEMPTNGTQPLTTLIFTLGYLLVGGAKKAGVGMAQGLQFIASIAAAWMLYRLGLKTLARRSDAPRIAALAAAAWFASPLTLIHSMNGLETGVYALVAVLVAYRFVQRDEDAAAPWTLLESLATGVLLGIAFWTRNDAAFLILAACLTYVYTGFEFGLSGAQTRFGRALIFGATSVLVATPWLGFNYRLFGHIVPVSGRAESLTAGLFANTLEVPPVLLEYFGVFVPIPQVYEEIPVVAMACAVPLLIILATVPHMWRQAHRTERVLMLIVLIYGIGLSAFYGLYFGAGWFMARYLFPLSPFLALLWSFWIFTWLLPRLRGPLMTGLAAVMVVMMVGQNVRWYLAGDRHPHFQVIEWADANIPPPMWAGAIQTGTLGYFHNRTVNLDGKVNIDAFYAIKNDRSGPYVVTTDIEYLLDWTGMVEWLTKPAIEANFRVLVHDESAQLAVLQRRDRIRLGRDLAFDLEAMHIAEEQTKAALKTEPADDATRWALLYQLAWVMDGLEKEETAEKHAKKALDLCVRHPNNDAWRQREVLTRRQLATVLRIRRRLEDALAESQQAAVLVQQTVAALGTTTATAAPWRRDLALTWLEQGELHWELEQFEKATDRFKAALNVFEQLGSADAERGRAIALLALSDVALRSGDAKTARGLLDTSYAIRKRRYEARPDRQSTYDYALAEARFGRLAHIEGDPKAGAERINASIKLRRGLPKIHPGHAQPPPDRVLRFNEGLMGLSALDPATGAQP